MAQMVDDDATQPYWTEPQSGLPMGARVGSNQELRTGLEAALNAKAHQGNSLEEREAAARRADEEARNKLANDRELNALRLVAAEYEGFRAGIAMVLAELLRRGRD